MECMASTKYLFLEIGMTASTKRSDIIFLMRIIGSSFELITDSLSQHIDLKYICV